LRPLKDEGIDDPPDQNDGERKYFRRREDGKKFSGKHSGEVKKREGRKRIKPDSEDKLSKDSK
jgi:hypothetical protein